MEDMERYGDYNEIDVPPSRKPNIVLIILKAITAYCILGVAGILGFRMILFNNYPAVIKDIYFNDILTEYYEVTEGNIGAVTQELRAKYDDKDKGRFFCDNLIVISGADQLQVSVRYNASNVADIAEELKLESLDDMDPEIFEFRLCDNNGKIYENVSSVAFESQFMYRYQKLVIDGVELEDNGGGVYPEWIRLEIFVKGQESAEPFSMVAIYENNEQYHDFSEYKLSESEKPAV